MWMVNPAEELPGPLLIGAKGGFNAKSLMALYFLLAESGTLAALKVVCI